MNVGKTRPKWFTSFISRYKRSVVFALALGLIAAGCSALLMYTSGFLISATAMAGITLFTVMVPVACVQLFGFGRPLARYLERLVSHDWVLKVTSELRKMLFWGIEKRFDDPAEHRAVGEYLGLLADDIAHLQNLYLRVVFPTAIAFLLAIGATALFGYFSPTFTLVMLAAFAIDAVLLPYASLLATRAHTVKAKTLKAAEFASLTDDIIGAEDWVLAGRGDECATKHADTMAKVDALEAASRTRQRAIALFSTLLLGAVLALVITWAGESFGQTPWASNLIAAFTLGFFPLIEAFTVLPAALSQAPVHNASIQRLDRFVSDRPDEENDKDHLDNLLPDAGLALSAQHVSYTYPSASKPAIDDISIDICEGASVAILGRSGSGKSTFAKLARGAIAPSHGSMRTSGHIGYLGQTPYLFNRTLRENLTLGSDDIADERLVEIIESVGLGSRFTTLPDGLDTVVGETGTGFSGGESHRIALARVLAADDPIVLVDEPFAALDPATENDLLDTLFETCADKTLVIITHHLARIERFDRVVFIEDGCIDLDGSPANLMRESERYRMLIELDRM